jgi:hypothetical protein
MNTDVPSGLTPVDKAQASGDIKSSHLQMRIRGDEGDDKNELIPETDRVQFSQKSESTQSEMMQHLTTDRNLNEYINMLKQAAELEDDSFNDVIKQQNPQNRGVQSNKKPDFMA